MSNTQRDDGNRVRLEQIKKEYAMQRKALDRVRQASSVEPRPSVKATRRETHRRIKINRRKLWACERQATDDNERPSAKLDLFSPNMSVSDNAAKLVDSQASSMHMQKEEFACTDLATPKFLCDGDSLNAINKTNKEEEELSQETKEVGAQRVKRSMTGATVFAQGDREVDNGEMKNSDKREGESTLAKKKKVEVEVEDTNSIVTAGKEERDRHIKCTDFNLHMKNMQGEMKTTFSYFFTCKGNCQRCYSLVHLVMIGYFHGINADLLRWIIENPKPGPGLFISSEPKVVAKVQEAFLRDTGRVQKRPNPKTTVHLCTLDYFRGVLASVKSTREELEWWEALFNKLNNLSYYKSLNTWDQLALTQHERAQHKSDHL